MMKIYDVEYVADESLPQMAWMQYHLQRLPTMMTLWGGPADDVNDGDGGTR